MSKSLIIMMIQAFTLSWAFPLKNNWGSSQNVVRHQDKCTLLSLYYININCSSIGIY